LIVRRASAWRIVSEIIAVIQLTVIHNLLELTLLPAIKEIGVKDIAVVTKHVALVGRIVAVDTDKDLCLGQTARVACGTRSIEPPVESVDDVILVVVVDSQFSVPTGGEGKADSKIITPSIVWKNYSVPELAGLVFDRVAKVTALRSDRHVVLVRGVFVCTWVVGVSNHSKLRREGFS
jgi:hypothetical protein